jgi:hypothetical protein
MTVTPYPTPADRAAENDAKPVYERTSYNWDSVIVGRWQTWQDLTGEDVTNAEALRRATRIRLAARSHAINSGMQVESRRKNYGRILDLRFTRA